MCKYYIFTTHIQNIYIVSNLLINSLLTHPTLLPSLLGPGRLHHQETAQRHHGHGGGQSQAHSESPASR